MKSETAIWSFLFVLFGAGALLAQVALVIAAWLFFCLSANAAVPVAESLAAETSGTAGDAAARYFYIREYRVRGAANLPRINVEKAVYPYLGPGRTSDDVEQARMALEKAYADAGYQAVRVEIPEQAGKGGVVFLEVSENPVGRLRVRGSRYFLPSTIKEKVQSLAEGKAINFNEVNREIVALSGYRDDLGAVVPEVKPGVEPGTLDVDLRVNDTLPLHGSLELNNRYSPNTTQLRLNGALSYSNLWQLGHSIGGSFDIAPEKLDDSETYSGYYKFRFPGNDQFSAILQASKQKSKVATLGGVTSLSPGESYGIRGVYVLPSLPGFYHSLNFGIDYKKSLNDTQDINGVSITSGTTVHYYPINANYSATLVGKRSITEMDASIVAGIRGWGDGPEVFENARYKAQGNFIYFRGELSHAEDLPRGFQAFGRVKGQIANEPLISNEQISGGGLESVRGYLEGEVSGDNAVFFTAELRSPSLLSWWGRKGNEWRLHAFGDFGRVKLIDALPEQDDQFDLASVGFGTRVEMFDHFNGSLDVGFPLIGTANTRVDNPHVTFRVWTDF